MKTPLGDDRAHWACPGTITRLAFGGVTLSLFTNAREGRQQVLGVVMTIIVEVVMSLYSGGIP